MAENIEIKARASDFNRQKKIAETLSDIPVEQIWQEDIFFKISKGRLKLRIFDCRSGELIYYMRTDSSGPDAADLNRNETAFTQATRNFLDDPDNAIINIVMWLWCNIAGHIYVS